MKHTLPALTILSVATTSGCSVTPTNTGYRSTPSASFAMSVAKAAGLDSKLQDQEVPKDTIHNVTDSAGYGLAMTLSGYKSPVTGVSQLQGAGLNFAAWVLAPSAASAKNHVLVWVPANLASTPEEAGNVLKQTLQDAEVKAATEMGYTTRTWSAAGGIPYFGTRYVRLFSEKNDNCKNETQKPCALLASARAASGQVTAPDFLSFKGNAWFFDPTASTFPEVGWNKDYVGIEELKMLLTISKYLPDWIYLYFAPNKVRLDATKKVKTPMMMNSGKIYYFITPISIRALEMPVTHPSQKG